MMSEKRLYHLLSFIMRFRLQLTILVSLCFSIVFLGNGGLEINLRAKGFESLAYLRFLT